MLIKTLSVSQLNDYISGSFSHDPILRNLKVEGEISNYRMTGSGHAYFALKDDNALINCVLFRGYFEYLNFDLRDGQKVELSGYVSIYPASGMLQFYVQSAEEKGAGDLFARFNELKDLLDAQGYFSPVRKRVIPKNPRTIGVISSPSGAVIHDICRVAWRRNPKQRILLYPAKVQGDGAANMIAEGVLALNSVADSEEIDVIILARGGGSMEDLWPFNERSVADAVFNSIIPVVSAVGHETDFTISDFVADLRAPTPSAAAEICTKDESQVRAELYSLYTHAYNLMLQKLNDCRNRMRLLMGSAAFNEPAAKIKTYSQQLDFIIERLNQSKIRIIKDQKRQLNELGIRLDSAGPLSALRRGYALIQADDGSLISSADALINMKTDSIKIRFNDGIIQLKGDFKLLSEDGDKHGKEERSKL